MNRKTQTELDRAKKPAPQYMVFLHGEANSLAFTDDYEMARQNVRDLARNNPGKRAWVAELRFSSRVSEIDHG